jgi:hypothetical protein
MVKNFSENWKKERVKGIILSYLRGEKGVSLKWVFGCLKGAFGLSKGEVKEVLKEIESKPSRYLLDKKRKIRLKKIKTTLKRWKEMPSFIIPTVKLAK